MRTICVIPARLGSTRFPRKVLAPLGGKPLIQWAYEGAKKCSLFDEVVVAVDSEELLHAVQGFGANARITSKDAANGTMRLCELQNSQEFSADIWVNWQADEPFITEDVIATLLQSVEKKDQEVWTLRKKIFKEEEIRSPNVVKVVCNSMGKALYFSRSSIPFGKEKNLYKHIGLYAYRSDALATIAGLPPTPLEKAEKLEQLRFLDHGMYIQVHETNKEIFGIDTREELSFAAESAMIFHA